MTREVETSFANVERMTDDTFLAVDIRGRLWKGEINLVLRDQPVRWTRVDAPVVRLAGTPK